MPAPEPACQIHPEVAQALAQDQPVVALESAVLTHGLPATLRTAVAEALRTAVRAVGVVPAMIALLEGQARIGLTQRDLETLLAAQSPPKCARVDLGWLLAQNATAGTTVSATIHLAAQVGIEIAATGGIGGVHRNVAETLDISADLVELTRTPIVLVCSGPKMVADLRKTAEYLETHSVPVLGYQTRELPGFYLCHTGIPLRASADTLAELAAALRRYRKTGYEAGILVANPVPPAEALPQAEVEAWLAEAMRRATAQSIQGPALTPFLLDTLHRLSGGATLRANQALLVANARLAAQLALACCDATLPR